MIKVGEDKRKKHSAEMLVNGLITCMETKDFTEINISDLQRASGVSRATFYRLFDDVQDVLAYQCQTMAAEIPEQYHVASVKNREGFLLFTLRYWLKQHRFLEAIFVSGRMDILQNALLENAAFLREEFPIEGIEPDTMDYLMSASMSILSGLLLTWMKHGKKETPEQLIEIFKGFGEIAAVLLC